MWCLMPLANLSASAHLWCYSPQSYEKDTIRSEFAARIIKI